MAGAVLPQPAPPATCSAPTVQAPLPYAPLERCRQTRSGTSSAHESFYKKLPKLKWMKNTGSSGICVMNIWTWYKAPVACCCSMCKQQWQPCRNTPKLSCCPSLIQADIHKNSGGKRALKQWQSSKWSGNNPATIQRWQHMMPSSKQYSSNMQGRPCTRVTLSIHWRRRSLRALAKQ